MLMPVLLVLTGALRGWGLISVVIDELYGPPLDVYLLHGSLWIPTRRYEP